MGISARFITKTVIEPQTTLHSTPTAVSVPTVSYSPSDVTGPIVVPKPVTSIDSPKVTIGSLADVAVRSVSTVSTIAPVGSLTAIPESRTVTSSVTGLSESPSRDFSSKTIKITPITSISDVALRIPSALTDLPRLIVERNRQYESRDPTKNSVDVERNDKTKVSKSYDLTKLKTTSPVIVYSADFVPIYDKDGLNEVGRSLIAKEAARQITFRTVAEFLRDKGTAKTLVSNYKTELKAYVSAKMDNLLEILRSVDSAHESLRLNSYRGSFETSFVHKILTDYGGFSSEQLSRYSQTKLWQQSLIEIKRILLAHTQDLLNNTTSRNSSSDRDPYVLTDIGLPPKNFKRVWINPYAILPDTSKVKEKSGLNVLISNLVALSDALYVDLSSPDGLPSYDLDVFQETGQDMAIAMNVINKEKSYSRYMKTNSDVLKNRFGYQISSTGDNFSIWDYLVGRFMSSVLDVSLKPTGNGNSLASFSQSIIGSGGSLYNILTLEDAFLQTQVTGGNSSDTSILTPGYYYYLDSSLSVAGSTFDTTRVDEFLSKIKNGSSTIETIRDMVPEPQDESGIVISSAVRLRTYADRLSGVTSTYKKCIPSKVDLGAFDSSTGFVAGYSLSKDALMALNNEEKIGYRLASVICKAAVNPTKSYQHNSSKLKSLLFTWLMNSALQKRSVLSARSITGRASLGASIGSSPTSTPPGEDTQHVENIKKLIVKEIISATADVGSDDLSSIERLFPSSLGDITSYSTLPTKRDKFSLFKGFSSTSEITDSAGSETGDQKSSQAYQTYVRSTVDNIFQIDSNKGIWKTLSEILRDELGDVDVYLDENNELTVYSGMSKMTYLFGVFDLALRIIAAQTPENLLGTYKKTYQHTYETEKISISEAGLIVDSPSLETINSTYNLSLMNDETFSTVFLVLKINKAYNSLSTEENETSRILASYESFFTNLRKGMSSYRDFLVSETSETFVKDALNLFSSDRDENLSEERKNDLINVSLLNDQITLSKYIASEIEDKVTGQYGSHLTNVFPAIRQGYEDFLPIDEFGLMSMSTLKERFNKVEFLKAKGNNKRILSIGIPPGLYRSITSTHSNGREREKVVRIKVYKLDRLHPGVVYSPQEFLFEINRFPTRALRNWVGVNGKDSIPTKSFTDGKFVLSSGAGDNNFKSFLSDDLKSQLYRNHEVSFLLEEYMRWFTDVNFDETRYHHYTELSTILPKVDEQYKTLLTALKSEPTTSSPGNITVSLDASSTEKLVIPFRYPTTSETKKISDSLQFDLNLTDTLKSYLEHETFVLNPDHFKRRVSYPKKFDRVFNVIVDPDDFLVDQTMTDDDSLVYSTENNLLIETRDSSDPGTLRYRHRDTSPEDIYMDEYFVTVEPYDFGA